MALVLAFEFGFEGFRRKDRLKESFVEITTLRRKKLSDLCVLRGKKGFESNEKSPLALTTRAFRSNKPSSILSARRDTSAD
ncbi:MAG: hypothetical protein U0X92_13985 [Anaerolineales bacterium]